MPSGPSAWCAARPRSGASIPSASAWSASRRAATWRSPRRRSFEKRTYEPIDDIDKVSCRPDFAIAVYSGYLKAKDKDELAPGLRIPARTPPVFLVHGGADIISPPEHSVFMYLALKRAGIPAELHVYAGAAHDFGVRKLDHPCSTWTARLHGLAAEPGFLGPSRESPEEARSPERPTGTRATPDLAGGPRHSPAQADNDPGQEMPRRFSAETNPRR